MTTSSVGTFKSPKHSEIVHVLTPLAGKYFELGTQLELNYEQLTAIENDHKGNQSRCLIETIILWQRNNGDKCSWSDLAKAVEKVGGYENLVKDLRQRDTAKDKDSRELHHPTEKVGHLSVSDSTQFQPQLQRHDSKENEDESGYSSKSESNQSGDSSGSEAECFELAPGCGCSATGKKPCSLYTFCAGGCPNPTRKGVSGILRKKAKDTTPSEIPLENDEHDFEDYEKSTEGLRKSFGDLVCKTCRSFKESKVTIQELTLYLQCTFPVMKTRAEELNRAIYYEDVFKIINQASSWFNYEIIADIIEYFDNDAAKTSLKKYKEHFKNYTKQRLPKGMKHIEIGDGVKRGGKQLVIKIDREWEEITFSDLDKLRGTFATILGVKRKDLYLADVKEGCIMMTFRITEELAGRLFPSRSCLTSAQVKSLKEEGVRSLVCGKWSWRVAVRTREHNTSEKVSKVHKKQNKRIQRVFDPSILMLLCLLPTAFVFLLIFGLTVVCTPSNPSSSPQILLESPCISYGTRLYCSSSTGGHYDVRSARSDTKILLRCIYSQPLGLTITPFWIHQLEDARPSLYLCEDPRHSLYLSEESESDDPSRNFHLYYGKISMVIVHPSGTIGENLHFQSSRVGCVQWYARNQTRVSYYCSQVLCCHGCVSNKTALICVRDPIALECETTPNVLFPNCFHCKKKQSLCSWPRCEEGCGSLRTDSASRTIILLLRDARTIRAK